MVYQTLFYCCHLRIPTSKNDYSLFLNKSSMNITIIIVYVDDSLITGWNQAEIAHMKRQHYTKFGIEYLCQLDHFLSLEVSYLLEGIVLS